MELEEDCTIMLLVGVGLMLLRHSQPSITYNVSSD
jgi:hypothetical protein